jgi:putative metalloprotease
MKTRWRHVVIAAFAGLILVPGAALGQSKQVDPAHAERLQKVMIPLIEKMDHPIPLNEVKLGIMDDKHINAANGGGGKFFVTTGLLERADENQLRAILAHETAHADLGHVTQQQLLATGLEVGISLLDQFFPGSSALTPFAGQLLQNAYSRTDELEADAHGVEILRRAGYDGKKLMGDTLGWLTKNEGDTGGGFFATHPATGDRIQAIHNLK